MSKHLRLAAEYFACPLWDVDDPDNIDPAVLPLRPETVRQLYRWAGTFQATFNDANPAASQFPSAEAEAAFEQEGVRLWLQLREELGPDYAVMFWSETYQTELSDPAQLADMSSRRAAPKQLGDRFLSKREQLTFQGRFYIALGIVGIAWAARTYGSLTELASLLCFPAVCALIAWFSTDKARKLGLYGLLLLGIVWGAVMYIGGRQTILGSPARNYGLALCYAYIVYGGVSMLQEARKDERTA